MSRRPAALPNASERFDGSAGRGSPHGQVWDSGGVADVGGALARGDAVLLDAACAERLGR